MSCNVVPNVRLFSSNYVATKYQVVYVSYKERGRKGKITKRFVVYNFLYSLYGERRAVLYIFR